MSFIPYGKQTISEDDIEAVVEVLKSDFLTTGPKVKEFEEKGILKEITGYERNKLFAFDRYLSIYSQS